MTDAFTAATPTYRRAQTLAARPLPLAAGEVAEYRRSRMVWAVMAVQLVACALPVLLLWAVLG